MRFGGNVFQQLKIVHQSAFYPADLFQQPVVKSLTASQPAPVQVKGHSRNQHEVEFIQRDFCAACSRFADAEFSDDNVGRPVSPTYVRHKFPSAHRKRAGHRWFPKPWKAPAPARYPVHPATVRKIKLYAHWASALSVVRQVQWIQPLVLPEKSFRARCGFGNAVQILNLK